MKDFFFWLIFFLYRWINLLSNWSLALLFLIAQFYRTWFCLSCFHFANTMQKDLNIKLIQTSTKQNESSPKSPGLQNEHDNAIDQEWEHVSYPTQDDVAGHNAQTSGLKEINDIKKTLYQTRRINQTHSWKIANQGLTEVPFLNVLILVIGSVGDILPFVGLGLEMKRYGHRVRFATHICFENTIRNTYQLDFFPLGTFQWEWVYVLTKFVFLCDVGGNPHWMMDFMVRSEGKFFSFSYQSIFKDLPASRQEVCFFSLCRITTRHLSFTLNISLGPWHITVNMGSLQNNIIVANRRDHCEPASVWCARCGKTGYSIAYFFYISMDPDPDVSSSARDHTKRIHFYTVVQTINVWFLFELGFVVDTSFWFNVIVNWTNPMSIRKTNN